MPALFKNNATATIAATITNTDTTIVLSAGLGNSFPSPIGGNYFYGTLFDNIGNYEIVKVTARVTDTLTVVRAQDSTNPLPFNAGSGFAMRPVAAIFDNFVQLDGSQTISGSKTFSSAINAPAGVIGNLTGNASTATTAANATQATTATTANSIANAGEWNISFSTSTQGIVSAGISADVLTVASVTSGSLTPGLILTGSGVSAGTKILSQTSATGAAVVTTKTFASEGASGQNQIILNNTTSVARGQYITGTGIPTGTTVIDINSPYTGYITLSNNLTTQAAGSYNFYNPEGVGTYLVSISQAVAGGTSITASSKKVNFVYNGDTVCTIDANGNVLAAGLVQAGANI